MLIAYRILLKFIFIISPLIFLYRFLKKKETLNSFKEKIGIKNFKRKGKLIWFHGASVGEIKSIIPLIEKFQKISDIKQILITSNTLSSLNILKQIKIKKVTHQFFPIDTYNLCENFLEHWKPSKVFFVDSEIWPNMFYSLKKRNIPIKLINGRITKKSFNRWKTFPLFSKKIFSMIDLCLASSIESKEYLKKLGVKKIKFFGNLKFTQTKNEKNEKNENLENILKSKKIWCASSTHESEEIFCAKVHLNLKKKFKNLLTIIIPRHVERSMTIKKELENFNLKVHLDLPFARIKKNTDIFLVNSYGKTNIFFKKIKNIFLGGSLVNRGGQNPIEAAINGCNVFYGPNISNFAEIYKFLNKKTIAYQIKSIDELTKKLSSVLNSKTNQAKNNRLSLLGKKILKKTFNEIK
jgi:3-deoxy-D-manno-octulosonic-acid transferase